MELDALAICRQVTRPDGPGGPPDLLGVTPTIVPLQSLPATLPVAVFVSFSELTPGPHNVTFRWVGPDGYEAIKNDPVRIDGGVGGATINADLDIPEALPGFYRLHIEVDGVSVARPGITVARPRGQ